MVRKIAGLDSVAILWNGLPQYAAAAIAAAVRGGEEKIVIIATRPDVPVAAMEEVAGTPIHWVTKTANPSFSDLGERVPAIVFTAGWSVPSFMRLAHQVRHAGGKVVCMCDNSFRGDARQIAGAVAYRLKYKRFFDHVWVPGKSAAKLMRFYGVPEERISQGLYTADTAVFRCTSPIGSRPLRFMFVGQFIERKNVVRLCEAFLLFRREIEGPCDLHLYGSGPLRDRIPAHQNVHVHPFATPMELSAALNESRCLVLPSTLDHWGLVVHEAASCGAILIVSRATGAAADLCSPANSRMVGASSVEDMVKAFHWAASLSPSELATASGESRHLAAAYSIDLWVDMFRSICRKLS